MRLIDGDILFRKMEEAEWYNNADRDEIAETLVLNAPTIEERKTGRWIPHKSIFGGLGELVYTCDQCGYNIGFHREKFCPDCGCRMVQEGEQP